MSLEKWEKPENVDQLQLFDETDSAFYYDRTVYWFNDDEYVAFSLTNSEFLFEAWLIESPIKHNRLVSHAEPFPDGLYSGFGSDRAVHSNFFATSDPDVVFLVITSEWDGTEDVTNVSRMLGYFLSRDGTVDPAGEASYTTAVMRQQIVDAAGQASEDDMRSSQGRHWLEPTSFSDVALGTTCLTWRGSNPSTDEIVYIFFFSVVVDPVAKTFSIPSSEMLSGYTYANGNPVSSSSEHRAGHCFGVKGATGYRLTFFGAIHYVDSCDIDAGGALSNLQQARSDSLWVTLAAERPDVGISPGLGPGFATWDGHSNDAGSRTVVLRDGRILMSAIFEWYWSWGNGVEDADDPVIADPLFGPAPSVDISDHNYADQAAFFWILDPADLSLEWAGWDSYHTRPEIPGHGSDPSGGSAYNPALRIVDRSMIIWSTAPGISAPDGAYSSWIPGPYFVSSIDISELHKPGIYIPHGTPTKQFSHWPGWSIDGSSVEGNEFDLIEADPVFNVIAASGRHLIVGTSGTKADFDPWYGVLMSMGFELVVAPRQMNGRLYSSGLRFMRSKG